MEKTEKIQWNCSMIYNWHQMIWYVVIVSVCTLYVYIQVYVYLDSFFPPGCIYCAICANTDIGTTTHCVCSIKWERNVRLSTTTKTTTTTMTVVATKQRTIYSIFPTYDENEWNKAGKQSSERKYHNVKQSRQSKEETNNRNVMKEMLINIR